MSEERRIEVEVEVPVSSEEAWEAIATGPGITSWFMPAEVDTVAGGSIVHHHDSDMSSSGTITAYERSTRFAYEESAEGFAPADDGTPAVIATEFLIEAEKGGTSIVRVVMSGFGEGEAWDDAVESFTSGWHQALLSLRLYLENFHREPVGSINAGELVDVDQDVWIRLTGSLGLPADPDLGDHISATSPDAPALAGTVAGVDEGMLTLLLEEPGRGIGLIGVGGGGGQAFVTVRAQLFGPDAAEIAPREHAKWKTWLANGWLQA